MLYHVSPVSGLKILQPRVSTHNRAYVYAIENPVTGILFGVKQDDFDFHITTDEKGIPTVYECYPNAFVEKYQGKSCSVYEVAEEGFLRGMTSWSPELVCESEVKVVNEILMNDLYEWLLEEEQKGTIIIHRYEHTDEYRSMISKHVVDRLIRFNIDLTKCLTQDERFAKYYREIVLELSRIMDGHLLK